ncbi:HAMP domain-containing histidine kinase [Sphingomonas lutea]|uniref:histidine kinase n=2 Tax=Sphingomonas lutea TaxID=1045317 RepID=A0A7G9SG97_9SPHN|nr:HAMP domain-containing histidine kinase [Sphingomonas lutea]
MKDEFVSTVSHELRTPLTSINGSLAILSKSSEGRLDQTGQQMLDIAIRNIDRLNRLINDILDIEKLGSGSVVMHVQRLELAELLSCVVNENRPFANTHGVDVQLELPDEPVLVLGDQGRLVQAVTNLIANACKFSPPGAIVDVSCQKADGRAIIEVQDTGPGIPVEFRPHVFQRFAQASPDHQQGRSGSGLGLAITKAIIEQHEGNIGFDSVVGSGSRFWLTLPLLGEQS